MRPVMLLLAFAALLLLVPTALADPIAGHATVLQVTDQAKHTSGTDSEVTFVDYQFAYSGSAPDPNSPNPADAMGMAWALLEVDHEYHNGQTFVRDAIEDNIVSYKVTFNNMVIQYDTTLHIEDSGWDVGKLLSSLNPFTGGDHGFGKRGFVTVHYLVYNESAALVADETQTEAIHTLTPGSMPNSHLWIKYENRTLTVTPEFIAHGILGRYLRDGPRDATGQVQVQNVSYQSLEVQVTATKTLEDVDMAYGFGRLGTTPGYTFGSLLHDAASTVGSLLGGVVNGIVDFVFQFVPQGEKILFLKDFVGTLTSAMWEVALQDPLMLVEDAAILALMYGILLFIDPLFKHIFTPLWALLKGLWKCLMFVWIVFLWIVRFIVSKIPTGGG